MRLKHSDPVVYKREQKTKYLSRIYNPDFSPEFRDEIEQNSPDADELRKPVDVKSKYKVVVTNHVVEVWEYEFGVAVGKKEAESDHSKFSDWDEDFLDNMKKEKRYDPETGEIITDYDPIAAKRSNARRARNEARRLVLANFDTNSKFITLTFRDGSVNDVKDVRECNKAFELFIKRLRKRYGGFKYLKVIEFQDTNGRGAVHYHFLSTLPYIDSEKIAEIWGHGFIGINRIEHVDNVGAYVTSYMLKDFDDPRLSGEKAYSCSKNLDRPIVLHGAEALDIIKTYLENKKEVFTNSYISEYLGKTVYKEFNLQREGN